MKEQIVRNILNIGLWLFIGVIIAVVIHGGEKLYYEYAPITNFIDFQKLDLADYKQGDEFQMVYSYRNSKIETIGDFNFKYICGGVGMTEWNNMSNNILLQKTDGLEKIAIQSTITNDFPIGQCEVYTHIKLDIHGAKRYIDLVDNFTVGK